MISKLIIHHFKSLEDITVDLSNITIFVGNNAAGKTNLIDAIRFVRDAMSNGLDRAVGDRHGIESIRQWSPTRPYRISFTIFLEEATFRGRYHFAIDSARGEFKVFREEAEVYDSSTEYLSVGEGQEEDDNENGEVPEPTEYTKHVKRSMTRDAKGQCSFSEWSYYIESEREQNFNLHHFLLNPGFYDEEPEKRRMHAPQNDELVLNSLRSPFWELSGLRSRLTNFQAYSIYPNTLRSPQEPSNETYLAPEGRNLASVFKRMRRSPQGTKALGQITEAMRSIMPNLDRIAVLSVGGYLVPAFQVVEPSGRGHVFNVSQLSDGTLRVFGLLTALYQMPKPGIIALEEPEQTVNPGILTVLADSIKEVSRRTQVLITTHSPNLLDQFDPELVKAVELHEGRTIVSSVSASQIGVVKDRLFSLGELLTAEGLHG